MKLLFIMTDELQEFIELYKSKLFEEKIQLGIDLEDTEHNHQNNQSITKSDFEEPEANNQSFETVSSSNLNFTKSICDSNNEDCKQKSVNLFQDKQSFLQTENSGIKIYDADAVPERHMLRYGEFSPNNPELRGPSQPYLGIGEYEYRKEKLLRERHADFQEFLSNQSKLQSKINKTNNKRTFHYDESTHLKNNDIVKNNLLLESKPAYSNTTKNKYVQTELQGIAMPIVQYALKSQCPAERDVPLYETENDSIIDTVENSDEMSERTRSNQLAVKIDRVEIGTQNNIIVPGQDSVPSLDYPLSQNSPRAKLMADLKHTYYPSFYNNSQKENDANEVLKVNRQKWDQAKKREQYHEELRVQIEQKQRQAEEEAERERREEQALTRRVERQLRQLQLERECEDAKRLARIERLRRNEEEYIRHQKEFQKNIPDIQSTSRRYQPNVIDIKTNRSEPIRCPEKTLQDSPLLPSQKPPYSFNIPQNSIFASSVPVKNYNADFLNKNSYTTSNPVQIRDSNLTHKNVSKKLENVRRRQLEDSLPIPVLRVKSPIAQNLKHSSVIDSTATSISDALKTLEGKWEVPAVQKNILTKVEPLSNYRNKNVLTQLGAIRMQLQQEQLRLDQAIQQNSNNTIAR